MFKFTWHIENFSLLTQSTGEFIDSPTFIVKSNNDVKAYVRLYPKGKSKSSDNRIIYYLSMVDASQTFVSGTTVKLSLINKSVRELVELPVTSNTKHNLHHSVHRDLIGVDKIEDVFLHTDNIEIECIIQKWPRMTDIFLCNEKTIVQTETYRSDIKLRKCLLNDSYESWDQTHLYSKTYSGIFTGEFVFKIQPFFTPIFICCKISLIDAADQETDLVCKGHLFRTSSETDTWEDTFDIDLNAIDNFANLHCEIKVSKGDTFNVNLNAEETLPTKIHSIESDANCHTLLKNLLKTKKFSDVTLQVGVDKFPAHKCVLGIVSDVFAAMFTSKMKEEETSIVNITDIDKDIVSKMLDFIYSGKVENLDLEDFVGLYCAADKYQILELKRLSSLRLADTLKVDNYLEVLKLVNMHQDDILEDSVRNFIYTNRKELVTTSSWKSFMKTHLELAADIMFHICQLS